MKNLLTALRLTTAPVVKLYRGFGSPGCVVVQGHALARSPLPRSRYRQNALINALALVRLFFVKPIPNAPVRVRFEGQTALTTTDRDGFFRLELSLPRPLASGWYPVEAELLTDGPAPPTVRAAGHNELHVPYETPYTFISDIDDTFLVSHSSTLLKRLKVLLTRNAHSRTPFAGVVEHYRQLAHADQADAERPNAFFYVSSSEWNLYDYIREFSEKNGLPKGVYLLGQLKRLHQLLATGQNKHHTKFDRVVRIIEACPGQKFILLGDDSQEDPAIYASVARHFPGRIRAVYLRRVNPKKEAATRQLVEEMAGAGVAVCYFRDSAEAMRHSTEIGLTG
jgi:phosphatidate phosphatase APP1